MMQKFKVLGKTEVLLGEGPMWDSLNKKVIYLDIIGQKRFTLDLKTKDITELQLPEQTGCMAMCENGQFIYAATSGIFDSEWNKVCDFPQGKGARFNDGKVSPDGRFIVGTIEKGGNGALFCLENGKLVTKIDSVRISNGLDWSSDGKIMYYCDTPTRKIVAYSYPDFKYLKTVIDFNEIDGFIGNPDGLCIDCEGNLWIAIWGGGCVVKVDTKTLRITEKIDLPAKYTSCPAFVGEKLDTLFVTSAKHDDDGEYAGRCFALDVNVCGREPFNVSIENLVKR